MEDMKTTHAENCYYKLLRLMFSPRRGGVICNATRGSDGQGNHYSYLFKRLEERGLIEVNDKSFTLKEKK